MTQPHQPPPAAPAGAGTLQSRFRPVLMGVAFSLGVILAVLGTALHGNIIMIGTVDEGTPILWGAALALLICLLAQLWMGLQADSLLESTVMGITIFTVTTAAYMWWGPDQLMVPYSPETMDALPGPTLASLVWWLGSAGVALLAMVLIRWILVRDAASRAVQDPVQPR